MLHGMTYELTQILSQAQSAPGMFGTIWSIFLLVMGFSLVIFVHELGHFMAAKWAGVRVEKFAIGFGKELIGFTKGQTRYSFNALPLGGYVKMLGQEDFVVDKSGELKVKEDPTSFTNKPVSRRMVIVSAGVIMNLLFAAVAFAVVVMVGRPQKPAVIGLVVPNSPAGRAGLLTGDHILAINDKSIQNWADLSSAIILSDQDESLVLDIMRDGVELLPKPEVRPEFKKNESIRQIGVAPGMNLRISLPALRETENPRTDELQEADELFQLVMEDEIKEFTNVGVFRHAIAAAEGEPVEFIVKRPDDPEAMTVKQRLAGDSDVPSTLQRVSVRATWTPIPYAQDEAVSGSLLGLLPRMTLLYPEPEKAFDKAGAVMGDVITKIDSITNPTYDQLRQTFNKNADKGLILEVSRPWAANHDLTGETVHFCVVHREHFIALARADVAQARADIAAMARQKGIPETEVEKLTVQLSKAPGSADWRRWFENVDIHVIGPIVPKRPFALFSEPDPEIGALIRCNNEESLVVASIKPKLGDRISPAKAAGLPPGAVILSAAGRPVSQWYELSRVFRENAGRPIEIKYRKNDEEHTVKMSIPGSIWASLNMKYGDRIISIDGQRSCLILPPTTSAKSDDNTDEDEEEAEDATEMEVPLPDWRAVSGLLTKAVGSTVQVEYVTIKGEKKTGTFAVSQNDTDPWYHRVRFGQTFECYPLVETKPVHNPFLATGIGFKQAYQATVQTIKSIHHMLFTGQIGMKKVSGPVGIVRIGTRFADSGMLDLLWFLAIISANLAVINFLPMPIVDGGLFLFLVLEKIRGEPISIKTQIATQLIGIALIATLFILITYQDVVNWITG